MIKKAILSLYFAILFFYGYSQAPGHVPYGEPEPVEFNLFNIILFIVFPVLMVIFYIYFRKKSNKKKEDK